MSIKIDAINFEGYCQQCNVN